MTALPKDNRLKKRSDFAKIYNSGAKAIRTKHFTFLVKPKLLDSNRMGVVVRKKIFKQAVKRNYIRRVANSLFMVDKQRLASSDIIAILSKPINLSFNDIQQDWLYFLKKFSLSEQQ